MARRGICCHVADAGSLTATVDTDAPDAAAWAGSAVERVRREVKPIDPGTVGADVSAELAR